MSVSVPMAPVLRYPINSGRASSARPSSSAIPSKMPRRQERRFCRFHSREMPCSTPPSAAEPSAAAGSCPASAGPSGRSFRQVSQLFRCSSTAFRLSFEQRPSS